MRPPATYDAGMPALQVVIIGAGGHGRELLGWLRDSTTSLDVEFVGFLDDGAPDLARLSRVGARHLGGLDALGGMPGVAHYVGIGGPSVRRIVAARAAELGSRSGPALVHPSAHVGADVAVGDGSVLAAGVVLTTNVRLGQHVHVSSNGVIGHDAVVRDFVSVYPGATISGNVTLESGVLVGTQATVLQGLRVGAGATVGAGAVVVQSVEPGATVVGVPARALRRN